MEKNVEDIFTKEYRFLIIEDDDHYLNNLLKYIKRYFFNINCIDVVKFAKDICNVIEKPYDVIICDIGLRTDTHEDLETSVGFEMIKNIRKRNSKAVIIAWTVLTKSLVYENITEKDAIHHLKAEGSFALVNKIASLLNK